MAVKYLAGKRIQGTDAERPPATLSSPPSGWEYLGRTTLTSAGDTIDVTGLDNKPYLMVLIDERSSGESYGRMRFNADTGNNYSTRYNDATSGEQTLINFGSCVNYPPPVSNQVAFSVNYIANKSDKEKLVITPDSVGSNTAGSGNAPKRRASVSKWANTSDVISQVNIENGTNGDFASGSEVVVLGYDPSATNTSNFWEQLASVSGDGTSNTLSTGTTIGKKYLWIQAYLETTGQQKGMFRVGNGSVDASGDYAFTISNNGGSDASHDVKNSFTEDMPNALHHFVNIFAINNASSEGLFIGSDVGVVTTGAGTAPIRQEFVGKWADTSNQFNILDVVSGSGDGNWSSNAKLTVWGAD